MNVAVVGAGAIGGYLGAKLALAGERVTFIARGRNLDAIRAGGMKLVLEDGSEQTAAEVRAFESTARSRSAGRHPAHGEGAPGRRGGTAAPGDVPRRTRPS